MKQNTICRAVTEIHRYALRFINDSSLFEELTENEEEGWGIARVGGGVEDDSECATCVHIAFHELAAVLVDVFPPFSLVDEAVLVLV